MSAHCEAVLQIHIRRRRCLISRVDRLKIPQVSIKRIVHVHGPELGIAELLPRLWGEVSEHSLGNQLLCGLLKRVNNLCLQVFDVCEAYKNLEEFEASQTVLGCLAISNLECCADKSTIDRRNVNCDVVHDLRLAGKLAEVEGSYVGPD